MQAHHDIGAASAQAPQPTLMANAAYRWYFLGSVIALLGDQFTLVAMPWLMLKMTGDPFMLGFVLAVMGAPRALFILFGGALVDRHTPTRVLLWSRLAACALLVALIAALLSGVLDRWSVLALAALLGVATSLGLPAATAIVPALVRPSQLPSANGALMSARQFALFLGPLLGGALIALFGSGGGQKVTDATGLALAFAVNAFTFLASAWTLGCIDSGPGAPMPLPGGKPASMIGFMADAARQCWQDRALRGWFIYWAFAIFVVAGPLQVVLPLMASSRQAGAAGFGALLATYGLGALVGTVVASARPAWRIGSLGSTLLAIDAIVAVLLVPAGHAAGHWLGLLAIFLIGTLGGYGQLIGFSWVQRRTPPQLMGRVMALYMVIVYGVIPLSAVAAGGLLRWTTPAFLLTVCGGALGVTAALCLKVPAMRKIQ